MKYLEEPLTEQQLDDLERELHASRFRCSSTTNDDVVLYHTTVLRLIRMARGISGSGGKALSGSGNFGNGEQSPVRGDDFPEREDKGHGREWNR